MIKTIESPTHSFIAYWPGEGGGRPLCLPGTNEIATWDSQDEAEKYVAGYSPRLQIIRISRERLVAH